MARRSCQTLGAMSSNAGESQISEFLAEYSPGVESLLREARQSLRACFAQGFELVFNNYNALVFGISPSARASESFISVAGYPRWVTLFFLNGAGLHDPKGLLVGSGAQVRSIRLSSAADMSTPNIQALIAEAAQPYAARLSAAPPLSTVVKPSAAKRRPRRPASPAGLPSAAVRTAKTRA